MSPQQPNIFFLGDRQVLLVAEIFAGLKERFGHFDAEIETTYPVAKERNPLCFADDFNQTDTWIDFVDGIMDTTDLNIFHEFVEKRHHLLSVDFSP